MKRTFVAWRADQLPLRVNARRSTTDLFGQYDYEIFERVTNGGVKVTRYDVTTYRASRHLIALNLGGDTLTYYTVGVEAL